MSAAPDFQAAVRTALALLERASDSWHNGSPSDEGPLHWPVAVQFARAELHAALALIDGLQERAAQLEAVVRLNAETVRAMQRAQAAEARADAWRAFQAAQP